MQDRLAKALLDSQADAIIATDRDGLITAWNPGATRIFGFTEAEARGRSLDIIVPEHLRARHWEGFHTVMKTGESRYGHGDLLSVPAVRKDDVGISVEFTVTPLYDEAGAMDGMATVLRDVSKRFGEVRDLRRRVKELEVADSRRPQG
jgi:PAS domain S-box-containing protein